MSIMYEKVGNIPLHTEPNCSNDTGFPFDDREEQEDTHFRSQLDDIAERHPEIAQHLGSFPFRSGSRVRSQIPEQFGRHRFTDRSFGEPFERFGFPFEEPFEEHQQKPYYQRYPQYYPTDSQNSQDIGEPSCNQESSANTNTTSETSEVNEKSEQEKPEKKQRNIQPSNTVDLGQPQELVDGRNQRSMSAPPPNSRQRFTTSATLPVNQPAEKPEKVVMDENEQTSSHPQERVIPIHVEGRDEPVIPKKYSTQNTTQPPPTQKPCSDKFFTQRTPNFSQYFNRDQTFQNDWFPRGFHGKQQAPSNSNQRGRSPQPQTKPEPQSSTFYNKTGNFQQPQTKPETPKTTSSPQEEEQLPKEPPKSHMSGKHDPIEQIKSIQKDVSELMGQVDNFNGKPKDKQYLYLDEMLTRNLIKLDNIDTQGQENIRVARKEAIKCIEKCISLLESKANANLEKKTEESHEQKNESDHNEMEVTSNDVEKPMDVEANVPTEEKMEIESIATEKKDDNESENKMVVVPVDEKSEVVTENVELQESKEKNLGNEEEKKEEETPMSVEKKEVSDTDIKEKKKISKKDKKK